MMNVQLLKLQQINLQHRAKLLIITSRAQKRLQTGSEFAYILTFISL